MKTIKEIVKAINCSESGLTLHYDSLMAVCEKYNINTKPRFAAFIANCAHETGGFRRFSENLNYSEKGLIAVFGHRLTDQQAKDLARKPEAIANTVYAGRYGNNSDGDGWKYRGRGILQTTFKDNYKMVSTALGVDFVEHPDLLAQPPYAAQSAGFFWDSHRLNRLADAGDLRAITRRINGGLNGYEERVKYFNALNV